MDHSKSKNVLQKRCNLCRNFTLASVSGGAEYKHHATISALQLSKTNGCDLCALIWLTLSYGTVDDLKEASQTQTQQITIAANEHNNLTVPHFKQEQSGFDALYILCGEEKTAAAAGHIRLFTSRQNPLAQYFLGRDILLDPSCPASYRDIKQWLQLCSKHPRCERKIDRPLPKRCLDVGFPGSPTIRLQETEGQLGIYIALSYCWGSSLGLVTTADNLRQHLEGFPFADLPATLAHAVLITRELGFKNLWIDGLCIVQKRKHVDNDVVAFEDWHDQASKMAEVYGNAFLTIAAAGAADKEEGCFIPRSPVIPGVSCVIPLNSPNTTTLDTNTTEETMYITCQAISKKPTPSLIDARAWCFQEGILSQRLLIYGLEELSFSCRSSTQRERINKEIFVLPGSTRVRGPRIISSSDSEHTNLLFLWYLILQQEFCGRSITSDSDVLPALAGVANRFQQVIGGRYLAGIWEVDFLRGLLWKGRNVAADGKLFYLKSRRVYTAPSWSWASKQGRIWYGMNVQQGKRWVKAKAEGLCPVEILDVKVDLLGGLQSQSQDQFGQVSAGFVKLKVPTREAVVVSRKTNDYRLVNQGIRSDGSEWVHSISPPGNRHLLVDFDEPNKTAPEVVQALGHFDTKEMALGITSLTCVFLWEKEGLMLVPVKGANGTECFERVGVFTVQRSDWLEGAQHRFVTIV